MKNRSLIYFLGAVGVFTLCFVAWFIYLAYQSHQIETTARQFSDQCSQNDRTTCLNDKIVAYSSKFSENSGKLLETFWDLEKQGVLTDDARIFSDIAHNVGMALIEKNVPLDHAVVYCGGAFKQGCIHGAVMEYIDHAYPDVSAQSFIQLCQNISSNKFVPQNLVKEVYSNCLHGAGHEIAAKGTIPLKELVKMCSPLTDTMQDRDACVSGVLMEYSKGTTGSGTHSHQPVGGKELPCSELDEEYQAVCYASAGSYRQYEPTSESFEKSYEFCLNVPEKYIDGCLWGVNERAYMAAVEDQKKLDRICENMKDQNKESICAKSITEMRQRISL